MFDVPVALRVPEETWKRSDENQHNLISAQRRVRFEGRSHAFSEPLKTLFDVGARIIRVGA
jgi:hypothetical protein